MRITEKNGMLKIETEIYQARNGSLVMNFGNKIIILEEKIADIIARDVPDFDEILYHKFYNAVRSEEVNPYLLHEEELERTMQARRHY